MDENKIEMAVLVQYVPYDEDGYPMEDDNGDYIVSGWDIWQDGCLLCDFHAGAGDTLEDARAYVASLGGYELRPEPREDWEDPVWVAYQDEQNTDAGLMTVVGVYVKED